MRFFESLGEVIHNAWNAITSIFSDKPVVEPCEKCPLMNKTMSMQQAQKYMDDFKKTDIPFDYPADCCYARARKMCDELEKDGFECKKFWFSGAGNGLEPTNKDGSPVTFPSTGRIIWGYHVAPVVQVMKSDGTSQAMILDPSLSNSPLTVSQWKTRCGPTSSKTLEFTSNSDTGFPFNGDKTAIVPINKMGKMTVGQAEDVLQDHKDNRDDAIK